MWTRGLGDDLRILRPSIALHVVNLRHGKSGPLPVRQRRRQRLKQLHSSEFFVLRRLAYEEIPREDREERGASKKCYRRRHECCMQATQICFWSITCHSKLLMNTRSACTQSNETKAVVKSNTCRRSVWGGVIQDVRSHKDLLCNAILFVGRSVCVAQYQSLCNATIAC